MAVVRLSDGELWIWSPIAFDLALAREVEALGPVRHLVSPNKLHHLAMGDWAERYPEALLWASPGLAKRRRDLRFHAELGDAPEAAWEADIDQVVFRGSFALQEVVFFHRASRTALVTDLVQRLDPASLPWWSRWAMRLDGLVGEGGSTPRDWRATWWNRRLARSALGRALAWDPKRLVIAHGEWVRDGGRQALAHGLRWLHPAA
jgi:hypothetical protein